MQSAPRSLFRAPLFWGAFLIAAAIAAVAALRLVYIVVPGLNLEISFTREQALKAASALQNQQFPESTLQRSAVLFVIDRHLQDYVELEAGGVEAFQKLIAQPDAVTHYWKIRQFSPGQKEELITAFSPAGILLSFAYTIAESAPGPALDETAARELAEAGARQWLGERFAAYKPLETRSTRQANGRGDYRFIYEHATLVAGEARFRIELRMAGDQLVAIDTFKHIPQAFQQRFGELRALSTQISQIASYLMVIVFGLGGLLGGGIWLFRHRQLRWGRAFWPAVFVSTGLAGATLANLPMAWMDYQTTSSSQTFVFQQIVQACGFLVAFGLVFATIYAVAEGLSRQAFGAQPYLWSTFKPAVAASPEVAGRLLGGYAWSGFFLLYAMLFIGFSTQVLGWWVPAGIESDPNILASWRPALGPIFNALQAGTWEECLFRAIPLSLAVLIGNRYGVCKPLVIITLIAQALIFAGAHANYPQLPGYSRLVELFIPAIVFGLVFLRFGLMVCMLAHFLYDLVWMSLPIFIADDASLWVDRALVILAGSLPLALLVLARLRQGALKPLADGFRNAAFSQASAGEPMPAAIAPIANSPALRISPVWMLVIGLLTLAVMAYGARQPERLQWPAYTIDRAQAQAAAEHALKERGVTLEGEWHRTTVTHNGLYPARYFVWHHAGAEVTQSLIGKYLDTPFWVITWRRFDGPVEERTEQWQAWIYPDGRLHELVHQLPEGRAGERLTRAQATAMAHERISALGWADPANLEEKTVEEIQRPARSDWSLTYLDKASFHQGDGAAAIIIKIAGDEVVNYYRTIDIPEAWTRGESEQYAREQPYRIVAQVALLGLFGLAIVYLLRTSGWAKISVAAAWPWVTVVMVAQLVVALLWGDQVLSGLATTMGWWPQLGLALVGLWIMTCVLGVAAFLGAQVIHRERPRAGATLGSDLLLGITLALALAAYQVLAGIFLQTSWAPTPYSADWSTPVPWLTVVLNGFKGVIGYMALIVLALGLARFITTPRRWWLVGGLALLWLVASSCASREFPITLSQQLLPFAAVFLAVILIRRQQMGVVIACMGVGVALRQLGVAEAIYPGAVAHAMLAFVSCSLLAYLLLRHWYTRGVE